MSEYYFPAILGVVIFSFISSCVYILNDYRDVEADRLHPEKKNRPLASGAIAPKNALIVMALLFTVAIGLCWYFATWKVLVIVLVYFGLNIGYSFGWKHIPVIDVNIIAFGFLLRVFLGGYITGLPISDWTVVLTYSLALILALGKRRGEVLNEEIKGNTRKSLEGYNKSYLNTALAVTCSITIVFYVMFVLADEVQERFHHYVFYTFVFVVLAILRYLQQTIVFNKTESPTKMVYKDVFLQMIFLAWVVSFTLLIYFK